MMLLFFWACAPNCDENWLADGFCDADCNYSECQFDGGDCTITRRNFLILFVEWIFIARCKFVLKKTKEKFSSSLTECNV